MASYEDLTIGTIVRTRTGKLDAIITAGGQSKAEKEAHNAACAASPDGMVDHYLPYRTTEPHVCYRSIKDGKAWGIADPKDLTII